MAKEKLFTPEDFDKPKDKSFLQKHKWWILGIAVLSAAIVLCFIFCTKEEKKEEAAEQEQMEQVSENPEKLVTTTKTEGVETKITEDTHEVANVESESNTATAPVAETSKPEVKQRVSTTIPAAQPTNVSDNVEQEAMNVIRGDYGIVPERREKLGSKFQEIQNRVNQLKKEGVF